MRGSSSDEAASSLQSLGLQTEMELDREGLCSSAQAQVLEEVQQLVATLAGALEEADHLGFAAGAGGGRVENHEQQSVHFPWLQGLQDGGREAFFAVGQLVDVFDPVDGTLHSGLACARVHDQSPFLQRDAVLPFLPQGGFGLAEVLIDKDSASASLYAAVSESLVSLLAAADASICPWPSLVGGRERQARHLAGTPAAVHLLCQASGPSHTRARGGGWGGPREERRLLGVRGLRW
mmetsp:Transcript_89626/g.187203  ORF Transcript_89626/g.187203 Transcript_89626/m.187203 type:complete len:236 (+) Transcript_89626:90-797(+)